MLFPHRDIGRCIYCDTAEPPLTREHVLPRGLGGNFSPTGAQEAIVLRNASCKSCQVITSKFENLCLKHNFGLIRHRKRLIKKERANAPFSASVTTEDGATSRVDLDPDDLHSVIAMPVLRHAGIVSGRWQNTLLDSDVKFIATHGRKTQPDPTAKGVMLNMQVHFHAFYQLLAKIAHGMAVARYGIDGFEHTLRETILGTYRLPGMWIGSDPDEIDERPTKGTLHQIKLRETRHPKGRCVVVYIRLFSAYETPNYYVVAGYAP
ncbi:hypothetical protein ABIA16_001715 [Sinorhizobium fredii]